MDKLIKVSLNTSLQLKKFIKVQTKANEKAEEQNKLTKKTLDELIVISKSTNTILNKIAPV